MTNTFSLIAFTALAAMAIAPSLHAAPAHGDPDAVKVKVSYADLNLNGEAGAKALVARIRGAAKTVCGGEPDSRDLGASATYGKCVRTVVDRTVASFGNPMVTAMNGGQGGAATVLASRDH